MTSKSTGYDHWEHPQIPPFGPLENPLKTGLKRPYEPRMGSYGSLYRSKWPVSPCSRRGSERVWIQWIWGVWRGIWMRIPCHLERSNPLDLASGTPLETPWKPLGKPLENTPKTGPKRGNLAKSAPEWVKMASNPRTIWRDLGCPDTVDLGCLERSNPSIIPPSCT